MHKKGIVTIDAKTYQWMHWYTRRAARDNDEIGGLGRLRCLRFAPHWEFRVLRAELLAQSKSRVHFEPTTAALFGWVRREFPEGSARKSLLMWHSHVDGPCNPSITDEGTIKGLCKEGECAVVSIITNIYGAVDTRAYWYTNLLYEEECTLNILHPHMLTRVEEEQMEEEYKVKAPVGDVFKKEEEDVVVASGYGNGRGGKRGGKGRGGSYKHGRYYEYEKWAEHDWYGGTCPTIGSRVVAVPTNGGVETQLVELPPEGMAARYLTVGLLCGTCGVTKVHDSDRVINDVAQCGSCSKDLS